MMYDNTPDLIKEAKLSRNGYHLADILHYECEWTQRFVLRELARDCPRLFVVEKDRMHFVKFPNKEEFAYWHDCGKLKFKEMGQQNGLD